MKPLSIKQITFTNFKNYTNKSFRLGDRFNLVYGLNGAGKTNLLDGIYYLAVGKSYFTGSDLKVVKYGEPFFRLEGKVSRGETFHDLVIKVKPGEVKDIQVDNDSVEKISDHIGFIPVVISAPRDIDLVAGHSQSRRRYFDHLLCQIDPAYLQSLVTYNHLLNLRTAALKQSFKDLKRIVETFDEQMAPHANFIFSKRHWLKEVIQPFMQENYKILSDDREDAGIEYDSKLNQYPYEVLADMSWEADRNTQRSNIGIQKDDFHLSIKGMPAKEYGSQGQIKSLIFALHLSKHKILSQQCSFKPLLILDDIFDKLDEYRLARLMEILQEPQFGQIFLSDTNRKRVTDFISSEMLNEVPMGIE